MKEIDLGRILEFFPLLKKLGEDLVATVPEAIEGDVDDVLAIIVNASNRLHGKTNTTLVELAKLKKDQDS